MRMSEATGEHLSGVHQALRIENTADPIHYLEVVIGEDVADVLALFESDPVFSGHRSARIRAELQDLVADPQHRLILASFERVEEHEWVKVAVASVEYIADLETGALADGVDLRERLGQLGARHDAIHHVEVGRQATHGREGSLAAFPERLAFGLVASDTHLGGTVLAADLRHAHAEFLGNL